MPKGSKQVPLACWIACRKSGAVSSSHFGEMLFCALREDAVQNAHVKNKNLTNVNLKRRVKLRTMNAILRNRGALYR
jgi:hypothetical protein